MKAPLASHDQVFSNARTKFDALLVWAGAPDGPKSHSDLENGIGERGNEVMREILQGVFDIRSAREQATPVQGPHVRAQIRPRSHESPFGTVVLLRRGVQREKGKEAIFALDGELNLAADRYAHPVRRRTVEEAIRGSYGDAVDVIDKTTGAHVPKRQAEQLVQRAATDVDAFYSRPKAANDVSSAAALNVMSSDSKGIRMHEASLREATRKAAEVEKADRVKGDPMAPKKLRNHDKRMAIVTANYDQEPQVRTPEDILAELDRKPDNPTPKPKRPGLQNKRVDASLVKSQAEGIRELFDEGERRDPKHERTAVVLVDGEEHQLAEVETQAKLRKWDVWIILDLLHVIHYLWIAGFALCKKNREETAVWVRDHMYALLTGRANAVAGGIRQSATKRGLSAEERKPVDTCVNYLLRNQMYLQYSEYLARGFPIATGVIEGACRHVVEDRMGITGAIWSLSGAEAVLRLRAVRKSDDLDAYWKFHMEREFDRNHTQKAA